MFDRSGLYNCEGYDISKTPSRFLTVMAGYTLMSDAELGISTMIQKDQLGKFISYRESEERDPEKLYLEDQPFFARKFKNFISDGLTCYRARRLPSGPW